MLGFWSTLIWLAARPTQSNPQRECRIKAAAVEAAGSWTKVNGVILQIKANSLDCCSCNPIIPRPHVLHAGASGSGGSPPSPPAVTEGEREGGSGKVGKVLSVIPYDLIVQSVSNIVVVGEDWHILQCGANGKTEG